MMPPLKHEMSWNHTVIHVQGQLLDVIEDIRFDALARLNHFDDWVGRVLESVRQCRVLPSIPQQYSKRNIEISFVIFLALVESREGLVDRGSCEVVERTAGCTIEVVVCI